MTTTSERCRALRWGAEVLDDLQTKPEIDVHLTERARAIAQAYPPASVIDALDEGQELQLSPEQIEAISKTHDLLHDLLRLDFESQPIVATLRHFPQSDELNAGFMFWPRPPEVPRK
jgi:hypothetical protein